MRNKKEWIYLLILCIVIFSVSMYFALFGIDAHHEGIMLKNAIDVANGKLLYKESFSQYGALMTYIQALFVILFGPRLWAVKFSAVLFYTGAHLFLFLITKRYVGNICALIGNFLTLGIAHFYIELFYPWTSVYALCFLMASMYYTILFIESRKSSYLVLIGVLTSASFWCRQPVGIVTLLVTILLLLFFMIVLRKKMLVKYYIIFLVGFIFSFGLLLLPFIVRGGFFDWWNQCMESAFAFMKSHTDQSVVSNLLQDTVLKANGRATVFYAVVMGFGALLTAVGEPVKFLFIKILFKCLFPYLTFYQLRLIIWTIIPIVNLLFWALCFVQIVKRYFEKKEIEQKQMELFCLVTFSLGSWHQFFPVPTIDHFYWGAFPMIAIVIIAIFQCYQRLWRDKERVVRFLTILTMLLLCSYNLYDNFKAASEKIVTHVYSVEEATFPYLDGIKLSKDEKIFYDDFANEMSELRKKFPDQEVFNYTKWNLLSCYTDGAVKHMYSLYGYGTYADDESVLEQYINENKPIIICDSEIDTLYAVEYTEYHVCTGLHSDARKDSPQVRLFIPKDLRGVVD